VSVVSSTNLEGGHVRRVIQALGIALMTAGFLFDDSVRRRNRRAGRTADESPTRRLPVVLVWIGAVLLVLSSI
jgi:predicted nucleic acid-binding Zn ribbon protein